MSWKFRLMKIPKIPYKFGLGRILKKRILLLYTQGRKTKKIRETPLQYDFYEGWYFIGSMRGMKADWIKNILNNPNVILQIGKKRIKAKAYPSDKPKKSLEFLKFRLRLHPVMIRLILFLDGVKNVNNSYELSVYASRISFVKIKPILK